MSMGGSSRGYDRDVGDDMKEDLETSNTFPQGR